MTTRIRVTAQDVIASTRIVLQDLRDATMTLPASEAVGSVTNVAIGKLLTIIRRGEDTVNDYQRRIPQEVPIITRASQAHRLDGGRNRTNDSSPGRTELREPNGPVVGRGRYPIGEAESDDPADNRDAQG